MSFDLEVLKRVRPDFYEKYFVDEETKFTAEEEQKWLRLRERATPSSPDEWFFLANELLGCYFQPDVHTELFAQFPQFDGTGTKHFYQLSEQFKKFLILWSRGTYKTTAVEVLIVACLLYDPDLVIMIISGNEKLAKRLLKTVKSYFESPSPKFEKLFPEYCPVSIRKGRVVRGKMGNQSEFTLDCRRDTHEGSPSVAISSSRSAKAGLHPDLLLADDTVNETNYKSPVLLEKNWEEFQMLEPLVNPGGYTIVTNTRYSYGDTMELIQELAAKENIQFGTTIWKTSIKTCWKNDDKAQGPMFPERTILHNGKQKLIGNSMDFLLRKKAAMGDELFACQYENNPIAGGLQAFTMSLLDKQTFQWLTPPDGSFLGPVLPPQGVDFVVGDLAFVGSEKRDTTVFYVCRLWNNQIWVFNCIAGQWGSEELTKQLWDTIIFGVRPQVVFIEQIPAWDSYDYAFRSYATQRDIQRYPIQWVQGSNIADAKKIRIGSLQSALAQGRLWLYGHMPFFDELTKQLKRFPKLGKHDDYADCLGWVITVPTGWYGGGMSQTTNIPEMLRKAREDDPTTVLPGKCGSGIVCG